PLCIFPITFDAEVRRGDVLADTLLTAARKSKLTFRAGDILVVKHKIVSKSEGQWQDLEEIQPTRSARSWARRFGLDPRVTQLALRESRRVLRQRRGVLITETKHGLICANSGVDVSNVDGGRHALLLPEDADASALRLHRALKKKLHLSIPVVITDTF